MKKLTPLGAVVACVVAIAALSLIWWMLEL